MNKWSLIDHLTNYLARPKSGDPKHPTLWPSEASAVVVNKYGEKEVVGKCRRSTFFRYAIANYEFDSNFSHLKPLIQELQTKELPTDPYLLWIWEAGNLYEDYIVSLAKNSGVFIDTQVRIFIKDYNVSGLTDLIVINPENYMKSIAEVKSVYGHNANSVLGSPYERRKGDLGTPRDSNLMQIALYDWHYAQPRQDFEESRLIYGSRDTGRYAEYRIRTEKTDAGTKIFYRGTAPNITAERESPITIDSILEDGYRYVSDHLLMGVVPVRDFELKYSEEKLLTMYQRDIASPNDPQYLSKKDKEQIEKINERNKDNLQREREGKKPLKALKPVEKGDWQCRMCKFREVCYNQDATPRDI